MQALSTAQLVGRDATGFACVPDAETAVAATADASSPRARHEHALHYAARSHATFTRSLLPAPLTRDCASRTITQKSLTVLSVCFRLEARPQADTPMAAGAGVAGMASQQAVQGGGRQQGAAQELRHCRSRTHHALPHALLHTLLHPLLHPLQHLLYTPCYITLHTPARPRAKKNAQNSVRRVSQPPRRCGGATGGGGSDAL